MRDIGFRHMDGRVAFVARSDGYEMGIVPVFDETEAWHETVFGYHGLCIGRGHRHD